MFTAVTVTNASVAADKTKYANWYSYYRTRRLMTRTATGRAFATLSSSYRVGFTTISDTGVTERHQQVRRHRRLRRDQEGGVLQQPVHAPPATPTRRCAPSLAKVGRYFANKASGQTYDPMQYSCQRNYAILSTDGYWNTGTETTSYGPFQLTTNTAVGPAGRQRGQADARRRGRGVDR